MDGSAIKLSLKREEPVPDTNDHWLGDKLERSRYSSALTSLVEGGDEPLVVALNGGWGTGKTFFLDRWRMDFVEPKDANHATGKAIYFSAWQDDDIADPLLAIVGQLHRYLHSFSSSVSGEVKKDAKTKAQEFFDVANRVVTTLGKHADGLVDHWTGLKPVEFLKDFANKMALRVDEYSELIDARVDLKRRLADLADEVWAETGKPLVFIIDDLDRCRPTFAIAALERIKHLFDVRHVVFVLGIDLDQFGRSLRCVYGDLDVVNYLNRLVDIEFVLPEPSHRTFVEHLWKAYCLEQCFQGLDDAQSLMSAAEEFRNVLTFLADAFAMTLRDMERITREFVAVERSICFRNARESTLLALLCALRLRRPEDYRGFVSGRKSGFEIVKVVLGEEFSISNRGVRQHLLEVILASYKHGDNQDASRIKNVVAQFIGSRLTLMDASKQKELQILESTILDSPVSRLNLQRMQELLTCFSTKVGEFDS